MDDKTQVALLRVLETRKFRRVRGDKDIEVDVRVIAATNESVPEIIKQKRFREDLYYRLEVFHIQVPPLRNGPTVASARAHLGLPPEQVHAERLELPKIAHNPTSVTQFQATISGLLRFNFHLTTLWLRKDSDGEDNQSNHPKTPIQTPR